MDFLPLELEKIIIDYKKQLDFSDKFKLVLNDIKNIDFNNRYYKYYTIDDSDSDFINNIGVNALYCYNNNNKQSIIIEDFVYISVFI
jgi:hypothetical protein